MNAVVGRRLPTHPGPALARWALLSLQGAALLAAVGFCAYGWLYGFASPPTSAELMAFGLVGPLAALLLRWIWAHLSVGFWRDAVVYGLPTGIMLLTGWGLTAADGAIPGKVVMWLVLVAEEVWWWTRLIVGRRPAMAVGNTANVAAGAAAQTVTAEPVREFALGTRDDPHAVDETALDAEAEDEELFEPLPPGVRQQVTRAVENSEELVFAQLRVDFAAGQQTATAHLAFCPPLSAQPEVSFEQSEGPDARIIAAQSESFGVRLDLKLAVAAAQPTDVVLQVFARAPHRA